MGQKEQTELMRYEPRFGDRAIHLSESIARRRERLGVILAELDRRRRDFFDVRKQMRKNAVPLVLMLVGVGGAVALGLVLRARRRRYERRLPQRVSRVTAAFRRAVKDPDRVAAPPPYLGKSMLIAVASAAASALAAAVVKRWAETFLVPARSREQQRLERPESSLLLPRPEARPKEPPVVRRTMW